MAPPHLVKKLRILWVKMYRMTRLAMVRLARLGMLLLLATCALVYLLSSTRSHTDIIIQNSVRINALPDKGSIVNSDIVFVKGREDGGMDGSVQDIKAKVGPLNLCYKAA
jgi:hypothetical protein